jgi:putative peptidoglycan lipid II flippase
VDNQLSDATERLNDYKETLAGGLRLVITLILPAAAGLFALAVPIIALLLEHGEFTSDDTLITARVLRVYIVGLAFAAVDQMLIIASYARKDTWRPAMVGIISIAIYTVTAFVLIDPLGLLSLMVADAVKHAIHTLLMIWLLRRLVGSLSSFKVGTVLAKSLVAAVLVGAAAYLTATILNGLLDQDSFLAKFAIVAAGGLAGVLTYIVVVYVLDIRDAKSLKQLLPKRRSNKTT